MIVRPLLRVGTMRLDQNHVASRPLCTLPEDACRVSLIMRWYVWAALLTSTLCHPAVLCAFPPVVDAGLTTRPQSGRANASINTEGAIATTRLADEESPHDGDLADFDAAMQRLLEHHQVPGAALAVTDGGRLVLARGYGYADVDTRELVRPTSLFRIASLSKPITAVAILTLVEQERLQLSDKVFDLLDCESDIAGAGERFDDRLRAITIEHLLQHRGGWDRDASFDPMFQSVRFARQLGVPAPASAQDLVRGMLTAPLDFEPAQRYAYSNFGYCLLGRVIEHVTGQTYDAYVREQVLAPLGIRTMRLGRTRPEDRAPDEVRYYHPDTAPSVFEADLGQPVPTPYGAWCLEAMDAHGGWLASVVDLARFATAFDVAEQCPILTRRCIEVMHARPPAPLAPKSMGSRRKSTTPWAG